MKTIVYSTGEKYYYVKDIASPHDHWLSVEKFDKKPAAPWISHTYQYDGEYFRAARPFTFWKIKEFRREKVDDDHELVRDYQITRPVKHDGMA